MIYVFTHNKGCSIPPIAGTWVFDQHVVWSVAIKLSSKVDGRDRTLKRVGLCRSLRIWHAAIPVGRDGLHGGAPVVISINLLFCL